VLSFPKRNFSASEHGSLLVPKSKKAERYNWQCEYLTPDQAAPERFRDGLDERRLCSRDLADMIEGEYIRRLHPCLNVTRNRQGSPLPARYRKKDEISNEGIILSTDLPDFEYDENDEIIRPLIAPPDEAMINELAEKVQSEYALVTEEQIIAFLLEDIAYQLEMLPLRPKGSDVERFERQLIKKRTFVEAALIKLLRARRGQV
jgi:hypothetical protein